MSEKFQPQDNDGYQLQRADLRLIIESTIALLLFVATVIAPGIHDATNNHYPDDTTFVQKDEVAALATPAMINWFIEQWERLPTVK